MKCRHSLHWESPAKQYEVLVEEVIISVSAISHTTHIDPHPMNLQRISAFCAWTTTNHRSAYKVKFWRLQKLQVFRVPAQHVTVNQGMSAERLSRGIHELQGSSTYPDIFLRESLTVEQPFCVKPSLALKLVRQLS